MVANLNKILRDKHAFFLCLDQGLEHGPKVFNRNTVDPEPLLHLALEARFSAVVLTPGVADKYYHKAYRDIPLIVKLNGRSELGLANPVSKQFCSVERAVKLGASAVAYTIYDGSPAEPEMFAEFGTIVEQAHDYNLPVIAYMYPRGEGVVESDSDTIAYAARIALELGADMVKVKYNGDAAGFAWVTECAGRVQVIAADPELDDERRVLEMVRDVVKAGGTGVAFGRTVWQHPRPFVLARAIEKILYEGGSVEEALGLLKQHS